MLNDLKALLAAPVPRYTSYPTAVQFHPGINAATHEEWLAALDERQPISAYVHVPFCRHLCHYCGCNTKIVAHYGPVAEFLDTLERELTLTAGKAKGRLTLRHLHFGGGTPTIVSPDDFRRMCRALHRHFTIADGAEIAVEIDPRTLSDEMARALAEVGVNRASLGVQDLDEAVQRAINRVQPFEVVAAVVERLRRVGIDAINFDLIYGLPLQTVPGFLATVDRAVSLQPSRIALFGYAHMPWMKRHQRLLERYPIPDLELRHELATAAAARLEDHGYVRIGLDHFARPGDPLTQAARDGRLRRNFQGYTTDDADTLLALGPSGISRLPQGYVQADPAVRTWRDAVNAGRLPTSRGLALTADDRLRADVIERLMCDLAVDLQAAARRWDACNAETLFAGELRALRRFADAGVIALDSARLVVNPAGHPYLRLIAAVFDRYLQQGPARHSRAI